MDRWPAGLLSVVLMIVLGGGPAVASACEALCSKTQSTPLEESGSSGSHHHSTGSDAAITADHHASAHDHSPEAGPSAAVSDRGATAAGSCAGSCCALLFRPRQVLATQRADAGLVPPSVSSAILVSASLAEVSLRDPRIDYGSPPGARPSASAILILRI